MFHQLKISKVWPSRRKALATTVAGMRNIDPPSQGMGTEVIERGQSTIHGHNLAVESEPYTTGICDLASGTI